MTAADTDLCLLALTIWREASNQMFLAKQGVAWVIHNRVVNPSWWGKTYWEVVTKKSQFTSMNPPGWDENLKRYPQPTEQAWLDSLKAAEMVIAASGPDPTNGALFYFDKSLDKNPPKWASSYIHTVDLGDIHFYKVK